MSTVPTRAHGALVRVALEAGEATGDEGHGGAVVLLDHVQRPGRRIKATTTDEARVDGARLNARWKRDIRRPVDQRVVDAVVGWTHRLTAVG